MRKIIPYFFFIISISTVLSLLAIFLVTKNEKSHQYETYAISRQDISNRIIITGTLSPSEKIDLAFEQAGKIGATYVSVGDRVSRNTPLIRLETSELNAELQRAIANLETEKARLNQIEKGAKIEEIQRAQTEVMNATLAQTDAENNLDTVNTRAQVDLISDYDNLVNTLKNTAVSMKSSIIVFTDIQQSYFTNYDQDSLLVTNQKELAIKSLFNESNTGRWTTEYVSQLNSGLFSDIKSITSSAQFAHIDTLYAQTIQTLHVLQLAYEKIPITPGISSTDKKSINDQKDQLSNLLYSASQTHQTIETQKAYNATEIHAAQEKINATIRNLNSAKDQLRLIESGATPEEISIQQARIKSQLAEIQRIEAQIEKRTIRAPFSGLVSSFEYTLGELINAHDTAVSMISDNAFEIEAFIPETEIASVTLNDAATILLDAYKDGPTISATVTKIDPAATIRNNVPTYKTTFTIVDPQIEIKSGMSGTITLITAAKNDVIAIPTYLIDYTSTGAQVDVLNRSQQSITTVPISLGLQGSDGLIEITEGLRVGNEIILKNTN